MLITRTGLKYIIVTGCLSQRYPEDILKDLPEVDAVLGTSHYGDICRTVEELMSSDHKADDKICKVSEAGSLEHLVTDKDVSTGSFAWIKIGEGCLHRCAFCAIPLIRGNFKSRPVEDIIKEAKLLGNQFGKRTFSGRRIAVYSYDDILDI